MTLIGVGALTAVGFASVYIARQSSISAASLSYAGVFLGLYLLAHLVARATVPYADPYLLPIAGLLTAVGITEIYRLDPTDAFRQGMWVVIGVALSGAALIASRTWVMSSGRLDASWRSKPLWVATRGRSARCTPAS